jgi:hypothetical protein
MERNMKTNGRVCTDRALTSATAAAGVLCAVLLAACGGSEEAVAIALTGGEAVIGPGTAASVQLEGCVVDELSLPRAFSPVRVHSADGRLVGDTTSDAMGLFRLEVPARHTLTVGLAEVDDETLVVSTGAEDFSIGACLLHRRDWRD